MNKSIYFLCGWALLCLSSCSSPPPPARPAPVKVTKAKIADVPVYLEYPGHVEAYKTVNLQAQVSGVLTGMYFEEGTEVKEGELLFTIDPRPYEAALAQAKATLQGSLAALNISQETVKRYAKLAKDQFVSQLSYDEYIANASESDATVEANKAAVETAQVNLSYCTLYAPMNAIAGKKEIDVGNLITPGENPPLIVLNQIDPIYASFYVPDVDLPKIQKAQQTGGPLQVNVYLNGNFEEPFEGRLTLIDNQVDPSTGSIFLKATLSNAQKFLWPGEFIDVRVVLSMQKNALLLPAQAVQLGQKGYFAFVIDEEDQAQLKSLTIGQRYGEYMSVLSGIGPNDRIVLEGQINLFPGTKVTVSYDEPAQPKTLSKFNIKDGLKKAASKTQGEEP